MLPLLGLGQAQSVQECEACVNIQRGRKASYFRRHSFNYGQSEFQSRGMNEEALRLISADDNLPNTISRHGTISLRQFKDSENSNDRRSSSARHKRNYDEYHGDYEQHVSNPGRLSSNTTDTECFSY
jgi:hypothetical protein